MKIDENLANVSEIMERRRGLQRNDSFSTTTSSKADAFVRQQYEDLAKLASISDSTLTLGSKNSAKLSNKESVHVGDVIYVNYIIPNDSTNCTNCIFNNTNNSQKLDRDNVSDTAISIFDTESNRLIKHIRNRKFMWICITCIVIALFIIIGTVITFVKLRQQYTVVDRCVNCTKNEESTTESISTNQGTNTYDTTLPQLLFGDLVIAREMWNADPPKSNNISLLSWPIKRIIIGHTSGESCFNKLDCSKIIKSIQTKDPNLDDIPYNFLIGGDGMIYEGRGFNYEGQHSMNLDGTDYNSIGICIAFIGVYQADAPNASQLNLIELFLKTFIDLEIIDKDYIIVSQDDLVDNPVPATELNKAVKKLKNYRELYKIYRRNQWSAQRYRGTPTKFNGVVESILIGHTETTECTDLESCAIKVRAMQSDAFSRSYDDTSYNFFVGADGLVFEGRGWDNVGAHTREFNPKSIGIAAIGDFSTIKPNNKLTNSILRILEDAQALGKLSSDYKIYGRSDLGYWGPGDAFMDVIKEWCRYGNRTMTC
ncbi:peptidoglycan recognition protein 3-like [Chironomus tepperi]|uniref:peptidoglycan recognition protein 3-like n=1 Tax=Chironomus tepperi TaxID=113505 RepID=UPI00391EEABF